MTAPGRNFQGSGLHGSGPQAPQWANKGHSCVRLLSAPPSAVLLARLRVSSALPSTRSRRPSTSEAATAASSFRPIGPRRAQPGHRRCPAQSRRRASGEGRGGGRAPHAWQFRRAHGPVRHYPALAAENLSAGQSTVAEAVRAGRRRHGTTRTCCCRRSAPSALPAPTSKSGYGRYWALVLSQ